MKIKISKDFTDAPGGRYRSGGKFSGQVFREDFIEAYWKENPNREITIDLDGCYGFAACFLHEVFSVLTTNFGLDYVSRNLKLISLEDPEVVAEILSYIHEGEDIRKYREDPLSDEKSIPYIKKHIDDVFKSVQEELCGDNHINFPIEITHMIAGKECRVSIAEPNDEKVSIVTIQPFLPLDYIEVSLSLEEVHND